MAAPTPSDRTTPTGTFLENGYQSLITFEADDDIDLWEMAVTGVGLDGGEKIDQTTMHTQTYRRYAPRALMEVTDGQMTVAYDPAVLVQLEALINVKTVITEHQPDGSSICYWGHMQSFVRNANEEGTKPTATVVFVFDGIDDSGDEQDIVFTTPAGTAL